MAQDQITQSLPPLKIGQHTAIHPIIQGGMAVKVSGANLAAAVANAGGVGIISSAGIGLKSPYFRKMRFPQANRLALIDELKKSRSISPEGIIGVNVMACTNDYLSLAKTVAANGVDLILAGGGLPLNLPEATQNHPEVALVPIVSSFYGVKEICHHWQQEYKRLPDAVIIENAQSIGGHLNNDYQGDQLQYLINTTREYLWNQWDSDIPLIVAGGIWDYGDIQKALALGAKGVQIGTRFITTFECDADIRYKMFHLNTSQEDVVIVPSPLGKPARAIRNTFAEKVIAGSSELEQRCVANCLQSCLCRDEKKTYCLIQGLASASSGDIENGLVFSGNNLGQVERIMSTTEVMAELTNTTSKLN